MQKPLRFVAHINRNLLPESTPEDTRIRYVDIGTVGRGKFNRKPETLSFGEAPSRARRVTAPGDVLVSTVRTYLRAVAQIEHDDAVIASTGFATLTAAVDVDTRYLFYAVSSDVFVEEVVARSVGVSYPAIAPTELANVPVPVPPLEVQRRIADYLDTETLRIDRLRAQNQELARLARERHERFILTSVTEGVGTNVARRPVRGDWFASCNGSFEAGPYAMYSRTGSGHTPSRSVPEYWTDCDIPWVTTGDVKPLRPGYVEYVDDTAEKISALGVANSAARLHPAGTVFLSRTASVGFAGIMAVPMATSQDFFTWTPDGRLRSEYLLWSLRAMRYAGHFDRLMYGSTHKTIYVPDLMILRGPIPPVYEQDRTVAAIREQRDETIGLEGKLEQATLLLAERRQALITAAVTGEMEI